MRITTRRWRCPRHRPGDLGIEPPPFPPAADPVSRIRRPRCRRRRRPSSALSSACRRRRSWIAVVRWGFAPSGPRRPSTRRARLTRPASTRLWPPVPKRAVIGPPFSGPRKRRSWGPSLSAAGGRCGAHPIVAAGGIADGRGVAAALALGAAAVQIGTAFLACDESNAHPTHKAALRAAGQCAGTLLTRGFTGRLGRGLRNRLAEGLESPSLARLPYPFQGHLVGALKQAALTRGRSDLAPFWSGQSSPQIRYYRAAEFFDTLVQRRADRQIATPKSQNLTNSSILRAATRSKIRRSSCPRLRFV